MPRPEPVTDDEISQAFSDYRYGTDDISELRKILACNTLKRVAGYYVAHSMNNIQVHLGLVTLNKNVTKRGREFVFREYHDPKYS